MKENLASGKLETGLLAKLLERYTGGDASVLLGPAPGRDAAVIRTNRSLLLVKSDPVSLVGEDIGHYLVAVNSNDIAVMAGIPRWFLATLILPPGLSRRRVEIIFAGIARACAAGKINWVGGHTEVSNAVTRPLAIGAMLGIPLRPGFKHSFRARAGDDLLQVKEAGIEGASILARDAGKRLARLCSARVMEKARRAVYQPGINIVPEAHLAYRFAPVNLMHDPTEGGIYTALHEMARLSSTGLRIDREKIAFFPPAKEFCRHLDLDPGGLIASGCLLLSVRPSYTGKLLAMFAGRKIPAGVIGRVLPPEAGLTLVAGKKTVELPCFQQDEVIRGLAGRRELRNRQE